MAKNFFMLSICLSALFAAYELSAREITDMTGQKVTVPDSITKVFCTGPPMVCSVYVMDQNILVGTSFKLRPEQKKFFSKSFQNLPVLGNFGGSGPTANMEIVLSQNPDVIINATWTSSEAINSKKPLDLKKLNIPFVNVVIKGLLGYPAEFRFLGSLFGREKRGEALAQYAEDVIKEIGALSASIPAGKRVSVYYAEDHDGLATECTDSVHAELLPIVGAVNVNRCVSKTHKGMDRINIEQVMLLDPDVILIQDKGLYQKIFTDYKWKDFKAVKNKRVYLIPKEPFNWFDRPPSFMRLLGVQWTASVLYPDLFKKDMIKEAKAFFKLFFGTNVTNAELEKIMNI